MMLFKEVMALLGLGAFMEEVNQLQWALTVYRLGEFCFIVFVGGRISLSFLDLSGTVGLASYHSLVNYGIIGI